MFVILAIDALEFDLVEKYKCIHLMQQHYGKTDISEFSEPRTMVLWSSFITGKNQEEYVLSFGDKEMWSVRFEIEGTFFARFHNSCVIDLPGINYDLSQHEQERTLLKRYFESDKPAEKEAIRKEYTNCAFTHHKSIRRTFEHAIEEEHDIVLGYFSIADVVGHLNFGNQVLIRMIYQELDEIASKIQCNKLILSDHGMTAIGPFGDHSTYGFWSSGTEDLGIPKITDLHTCIDRLSK